MALAVREMRSSHPNDETNLTLVRLLTVLPPENRHSSNTALNDLRFQVNPGPSGKQIGITRGNHARHATASGAGPKDGPGDRRNFGRHRGRLLFVGSASEQNE